MTTKMVEKSKLTEKYDNDMCSAGHSLESGDTEYGCDIQTHSTVNVAPLCRDIDTVRSRRAGNRQTVTGKSSQDRGQNRLRVKSRYSDPQSEKGFAGTLHCGLMFLWIVILKTLSLVGRNCRFAELLKTTNVISIGQVEVKGGQSYFDTSWETGIAMREIPTRLELVHISLYNGNQGRVLFRIGDKRNIPPSNTMTMAMIFFFLM